MTAEPIRLVEAALFSAGKPISVEEIVQATKLPPADVGAALKQLSTEYEGRTTALEVVKSGPKWAMAVRAAYSDSTKMLAAPEIPRKVLKTLTLIAFHQPIKQSDLKDIVGSVIYDHVKELHERGMVTVREAGVTKMLQTTDRFLDYFGIDATDQESMRSILAQRLGIDPATIKLPKPQPPAEGAPTADAPTGDAAPASAPIETPAAPAATGL